MCIFTERAHLKFSHGLLPSSSSESRGSLGSLNVSLTVGHRHVHMHVYVQSWSMLCGRTGCLAA